MINFWNIAITNGLKSKLVSRTSFKINFWKHYNYNSLKLKLVSRTSFMINFWNIAITTV